MHSSSRALAAVVTVTAGTKVFGNKATRGIRLDSLNSAPCLLLSSSLSHSHSVTRAGRASPFDPDLDLQ